MSIMLCFWHNNLGTVSLSPDVCSDSCVMGTTCLVLVTSRDSSDAESWRGGVGLGTEVGTQGSVVLLEGCSGHCRPRCPRVQELRSGRFRALLLFHWLLRVSCMCAETEHQKSICLSGTRSCPGWLVHP